MRVAVTYENGVIFQHFGKCPCFLLVDVEDQHIKQKSLLHSDGQGHGALAVLLQQANVDVLICGGCGQGARSALEAAGISVIGGAKGNAELAIDAYLRGDLHDDPSNVCHHHDEEHHDCGNHGCHH